MQSLSHLQILGSDSTMAAGKSIKGHGPGPLATGSGVQWWGWGVGGGAEAPSRDLELSSVTYSILDLLE